MRSTGVITKCLTLREAFDELVPLELRARWQDALEMKRKFERQHDIGRRRRVHRNRWVLDVSRDSCEIAPVHDPAKSKEYLNLKAAVAVAKRKVMEIFYARLADCTVEARKGSPAERSMVIPRSALPSPDGHRKNQLRIVSFDASTMAFGLGDNKVEYYDVQIWPPDNFDNGQAHEEAEITRQVANAALAHFLEETVSLLEPGAPGLTEDALWDASKKHFPEHLVSRRQIRVWITSEMDPSKRFRRGLKPRKLP